MATLQAQLTLWKTDAVSVVVTRIGAVPVIGKITDDGSVGDSIVVQHESGMSDGTFSNNSTVIPKAAIAGIGFHV